MFVCIFCHYSLSLVQHRFLSISCPSPSLSLVLLPVLVPFDCYIHELITPHDPITHPRPPTSVPSTHISIHPAANLSPRHPHQCSCLFLFLFLFVYTLILSTSACCVPVILIPRRYSLVYVSHSRAQASFLFCIYIPTYTVNVFEPL